MLLKDNEIKHSNVECCISFQNLLHPLWHVTHLHFWLPFAIKIRLKIWKSHKICPYCGLLSFEVFHNMYKAIKSGNERRMQKWTEEVLESSKTLFLCFSLCTQQFSKTPNVVTVLWLDSDDVVTILSPTRNLVEGYKTVYLVSSHVVTVQLPTRCLVDRFLHRPHGSGYLITCVSDVVTVEESRCRRL